MAIWCWVDTEEMQCRIEEESKNPTLRSSSQLVTLKFYFCPPICVFISPVHCTFLLKCLYHSYLPSFYLHASSPQCPRYNVRWTVEKKIALFRAVFSYYFTIRSIQVLMYIHHPMPMYFINLFYFSILSSLFSHDLLILLLLVFHPCFLTSTLALFPCRYLPFIVFVLYFDSLFLIFQTTEAVLFPQSAKLYF